MTRGWSVWGAAAGLLAAWGQAQGQAQAAGTAAPAASEAPVLEQVTVTAQRREQAAQSVGAALSVLPGRSLKDKGVANVNDLQTATPSLEVEPAFGGGQPQFRLRGVGFTDYTPNNSSPVGVSIDEVAYPFPVQTQGLLFDLNRVEVLRGPQGTLYGRNTTGGAVNFITNRPTAEPHAGFTAEYGRDDAFNLEGFVSGPLSPELRGRLSFATAQGGAWQHERSTGESLGDNDQYALRGQLEWDATRAVSARLGLHALRDRSDNPGLLLFSPFTPTAGGAPIPADTDRRATGWGLRPAFAERIGVAANAKPGKDNTGQGADLTVQADLGAVALTSITAYNSLKRRELSDWDATAYAESDEYFRDDIEVFSQELRLASTGSGRLGWVAGLYYSHEKLDERFDSDFTDRLGGDAQTSYQQTGRSIGVFGQATYALTSQLTGIAGLRLEDEKRSLEHLTTGFITPPVPFVTDQSRSTSSSDVSGKLALEWRPEAARLYYASLSRGVKSGGFTAHNTVNAEALTPFKPEVLVAWEAGIKADLAANLRVNAAAFHYDYRDQQVLSAVFDTGTESLIGTFVNAPRSKIDGVEVELQWEPLKGLELAGYLGYKEGKYTKTFVTYDTQGSVTAGTNVFTDFNGAALSFPKLSYGASVAYAFTAADLRWRAEANASWRDRYSQLLLLGPNYTLSSYWLANANVSVTPVGSRWTFGVWGRNVFDRRYDVTRNFFLPGTDVAAAGRPASYGVRVSWAY